MEWTAPSIGVHRFTFAPHERGNNEGKSEDGDGERDDESTVDSNDAGSGQPVREKRVHVNLRIVSESCSELPVLFCFPTETTMCLECPSCRLVVTTDNETVLWIVPKLCCSCLGLHWAELN